MPARDETDLAVLVRETVADSSLAGRTVVQAPPALPSRADAVTG